MSDSSRSGNKACVSPPPGLLPLGQWKRCECGGKVERFLHWILQDWISFWFCASCKKNWKGERFPD